MGKLERNVHGKFERIAKQFIEVVEDECASLIKVFDGLAFEINLQGFLRDFEVWFVIASLLIKLMM